MRHRTLGSAPGEAINDASRRQEIRVKKSTAKKPRQSQKAAKAPEAATALSKNEKDWSSKAGADYRKIATNRQQQRQRKLTQRPLGAPPARVS